MNPKISIPLVDFITGKRINTVLKELRKTQWMSRDELRELQEQKLRKLIYHAYNNVPYCHNLFKQKRLLPNDIKNYDDLQKIPVLTREIIRENFPQDMVAKNYKIKDLFYGASSGSTGTPLQFYGCKNYLSYVWASMYRYYEWMNFNLGDKMLLLWGSPFIDTHFGGIKRSIKSILYNIKRLNTFNMSENTLEKYLRIAENFKPKLIRGYASAVYLLAKKAVANNSNKIRPLAISTTAQMLFSYQRNLIEEAFACKVFDQYACGEVNGVACECECHNGYHINDEHVIVEILENNERVKPGKMGEIVLTELENYAMPFIRYKPGDLGVISDQLCACGRGLSKLESVKGRTQQLIITPEKKYFTVEFFVVFFEHIKGIDQFQVIQSSSDTIIFKIVKNNKFIQKDLLFIKNGMKERMGESMKTVIEFVDKIEPSPSGKFRFVISNITNSGDNTQ